MAEGSGYAPTISRVLVKFGLSRRQPWVRGTEGRST